MPRLYCLPDTPRPRKARRYPSVPSSMGTAHVRVALLLLHLRHPRVQFHKAVHCRVLASSDTADKIQMGTARHTRYAFVYNLNFVNFLFG